MAEVAGWQRVTGVQKKERVLVPDAFSEWDVRFQDLTGLRSLWEQVQLCESELIYDTCNGLFFVLLRGSKGASMPREPSSAQADEKLVEVVCGAKSEFYRLGVSCGGVGLDNRGV